MESAARTKQAQFRLPIWVHSFLEERSTERQESKTQIIIEAVSCLRQRELETEMATGYLEYADVALEISESSLGAADTLPQW